MKNVNITKELFDDIWNQIDAHNEKTYNSVEFGDILFTYFNNETFDNKDGHLLIYNDWDEGRNNDPFWDDNRDCHSAISFIMDMCQLIKNHER